MGWLVLIGKTSLRTVASVNVISILLAMKCWPLGARKPPDSCGLCRARRAMRKLGAQLDETNWSSAVHVIGRGLRDVDAPARATARCRQSDDHHLGWIASGFDQRDRNAQSVRAARIRNR